MKVKKTWRSERIYINEIIRINYKCNWKCKFCNVLKVNNYWEHDVSDKEIIFKILSLVKKYSDIQRSMMILSFSWWEPTLNQNLTKYIRLAKKIWVWTVEIQTNGTMLFLKKNLTNELMDAWLNEIFLAQHSHLDKVNKELWVYYKIEDFIDWVKYVTENNIFSENNIYMWKERKRPTVLYLNIVVWKINLPYLKDYIKFLIDVWFLKYVWKTTWIVEWKELDLTKISFWLTQPNWYAEINAKDVLLKYDEKEMKYMTESIDFCKENNIFCDFHFTSPPICVLNYPEYNLEHSRLEKLEKDKKEWRVNEWNLESYKELWKEKIKFEECKKCEHDKYCLWFYRNWVKFFWEEYAKEKINTFLKK